MKATERFATLLYAGETLLGELQLTMCDWPVDVYRIQPTPEFESMRHKLDFDSPERLTRDEFDRLDLRLVTGSIVERMTFVWFRGNDVTVRDGAVRREPRGR